MATKKYFTGFSTIGSDVSRNWTYYDIELVKRDLLNHFNTRIGERVMRPTFGCRIWEYFMEPLTESLRDDVISEAIRVCNSDTRVSVVSVNVFELNNGLRVEITLNYIPFSVVETFYVDFEQRETLRLEQF